MLSLPPSRRTPALLLCFVALAALGVLEARTPAQLSFGVFYYFPVVAATWFGGPRWGAFAAAVAAGDYLAANYACSPVFDDVGLRLWTTGNELVGELFLVYVVARLRRAVTAARDERRRAEAAVAQVHTLEELLPVCAWCGHVRDDKGYWASIEAYLGARAGTKFSHSICPSCTDKLDHEDGPRRSRS